MLKQEQQTFVNAYLDRESYNRATSEEGTWRQQPSERHFQMMVRAEAK